MTELVEISGLRQPQVSKHLKVLADASLVSVRADGRRRHYRLDGNGLKAAHDWFASFEDPSSMSPLISDRAHPPSANMSRMSSVQQTGGSSSSLTASLMDSSL